MELDVPSELRVVSAHRTPDQLFRYAEEAAGRGIRVIVAGAGGAAHLPGMLAAKTLLPVIGVPIPTQHLGGMDSLLSIVQMPRGIPVATVAIGNAMNAGLLAAQILALVRRRARARGWRPGARRRPRASWTTPRTPRADAGPADQAADDGARRQRALAVLGEVEPDVEHDLEHDEDGDGRSGRPGQRRWPCHRG